MDFPRQRGKCVVWGHEWGGGGELGRGSEGEGGRRRKGKTRTRGLLLRHGAQLHLLKAFLGTAHSQMQPRAERRTEICGKLSNTYNSISYQRAPFDDAYQAPEERWGHSVQATTLSYRGKLSLSSCKAVMLHQKTKTLLFFFFLFLLTYGPLSEVYLWIIHQI